MAIKLIQLLEQNKRYNLYVDLDGVLTNFEYQFKQISNGISIDKYESKFGADATWQLVGESGEEFWSQMPWMTDGKKLWSYVKYKEPKILSTPSRNKSSKTGKIKWVKQNLGSVEILLEENKEKYSSNNSILIDDTKENIDKWNAKNGIGILHTNASDTIKKLKEIGI